jgi:hypothetical protein
MSLRMQPLRKPSLLIMKMVVVIRGNWTAESWANDKKINSKGWAL